MSDNHETRPASELAPVNNLLNDGFERCHALVDEYRAKLARISATTAERPLMRWRDRGTHGASNH